MITGIHNAHYWSADIDGAVAFYRDVLGLTLAAQYGDDWAEFDVAGSTIAIHGSRGATPPHAGATVVFAVDDLEATMRAIGARGVTFEGEVTEVPDDGGRFASFRDPAGNLVQIFEPGT